MAFGLACCALGLLARAAPPRMQMRDQASALTPLNTSSLTGAIVPSSSGLKGAQTAIAMPGGALRTWSYRSPMVQRVQVEINTGGRPLDADIELRAGADRLPCKIRAYAEDGQLNPFRAVIETPSEPNTVAICNLGQYFKFTANVIADNVIEPTEDCVTVLKTIAGAGLRAYSLDPAVESVQVYLGSDGCPLNVRIELLQGPENTQQAIELYTEDGSSRPFFCVINTPGSGNVLRIVNTDPSASIEAAVTPRTFGPGAQSEIDSVREIIIREDFRQRFLRSDRSEGWVQAQDLFALAIILLVWWSIGSDVVAVTGWQPPDVSQMRLPDASKWRVRDLPAWFPDLSEWRLPTRDELHLPITAKLHAPDVSKWRESAAPYLHVEARPDARISDVSRWRLPTAAELGLPKASEIRFPDLSKLKAPDLTGLRLPDQFSWRLPTVAEFHVPGVNEMRFPDMSKVKFPDAPEKWMPDVSKFNLPQLHLPDAPKVQMPGRPEAKVPDFSKVQLKEWLENVKLPEVPEGKLPEAVQARLPDLSKVKLPELSLPEAVKEHFMDASQLHVPDASEIRAPELSDVGAQLMPDAVPLDAAQSVPSDVSELMPNARLEAAQITPPEVSELGVSHGLPDGGLETAQVTPPEVSEADVSNLMLDADLEATQVTSPVTSDPGVSEPMPSADFEATQVTLPKVSETTSDGRLDTAQFTRPDASEGILDSSSPDATHVATPYTSEERLDASSLEAVSDVAEVQTLDLSMAESPDVSEAVDHQVVVDHQSEAHDESSLGNDELPRTDSSGSSRSTQSDVTTEQS